MKKVLKWLAAIILLLLIAYIAGPKPPKPQFRNTVVMLPDSLSDLEYQINEAEKSVKGLKPDNQARIIWADSAKKEKTKVAFLYLHGFSASQEEGYPVHIDLAHEFSANLYLSRLSEHGTDNGDSTMINLTADNYVASAEKALAIAERLGDEIVVIGTSAGGALALFLASQHPEIKALILYSPCIKLYDKTSVILDKPWGLQIARLANGGPIMRFKAESEAHARYWQLNYRVEALVALQNLIDNTMNPKVFSKIKCPVFLGYYYKNENEQDHTVSVPAMLKMFDELGTPASLKEKEPFPEAGVHVIVSEIRTKDWKKVEIKTDEFLKNIVGLQEIHPISVN